MALVVQEKFVNKYKQQYYQGNLQVEQLKKQQKQLLKLLDDLYEKVNKCFDRACFDAEKKCKSNRNSSNRENQSYLPSLIIGAQLKNSKTYRQILENEKDKLQKRMQLSVNMIQKNINMQIKNHREKVINLTKRNKSEKFEIKKLGQILNKQNNVEKQTYQQLFAQVKDKRNDNQKKKQKINENQTKISKLKQKINEVQQQIQDILIKYQCYSDQQEQQNQRLIKKYKKLQNIRDKTKENINSIKTRLNQQYFCKLKQLQALIKKDEEIEEKLQNLQFKLVQKNEQMTKSIIMR